MADGQSASAVSAVNTRRHVSAYERKYADYATAFSTSERSIKGWVKFGKQLQDLPPLDRPADMAAWWARVMKHRVPAKLLELATVPDVATSAQPELPPRSAPSSAPPQPRDFSHVQPLDIAANVAHLRHTHAINAHLLDEAYRENDPNLTSLRQRNFDKSFELLRKAEQSLIEIQRERGQALDRDTIEQELAQVVESLRVMHATMPTRILAELEKMLPRRVGRVFRALETVLRPAIDKVRSAEEEVFRNLPSLKGPADLREQLLAA